MEENSSVPEAAAETAAGIDLDRAFREHHAMVFRTAYRVTGNAGDAEDVLQTVFLRLLGRSADADPVGSLEPYLRRAAVNAALDLLRSRQAAVSLDAEADVAAPACQDPDRLLAAGGIRQWLRQAVARLSPRAAEMIALRFFEGKENPEIARMLGTSEGSVAVTLSRARDRLEREYQAYAGGSREPRKQTS